MKKERYFRHELERMFIAYAIVPAVIFTMVCGMLFMTVLLHGKRSGNIEHNRYVAGLLDNVLARYEEGVEEMASQPGCFDNIRDPDGKAELFGIFYGITNSLGLEGDLFVMDSSRNILLSSRSDLPQFLDVPEDVRNWSGIPFPASLPMQILPLLMQSSHLYIRLPHYLSLHRSRYR